MSAGKSGFTFFPQNDVIAMFTGSRRQWLILIKAAMTLSLRKELVTRQKAGIIPGLVQTCKMASIDAFLFDLSGNGKLLISCCPLRDTGSMLFQPFSQPAHQFLDFPESSLRCFRPLVDPHSPVFPGRARISRHHVDVQMGDVVPKHKGVDVFRPLGGLQRGGQAVDRQPHLRIGEIPPTGEMPLRLDHQMTRVDLLLSQKRRLKDVRVHLPGGGQSPRQDESISPDPQSFVTGLQHFVGSMCVPAAVTPTK